MLGTLAQLAAPATRRLYVLLARRLLARFLASPLEDSQLDISLSRRSVTLHSAILAAPVLNDLLADVPVSIVHARAGSVSAALDGSAGTAAVTLADVSVTARVSGSRGRAQRSAGQAPLAESSLLASTASARRGDAAFFAPQIPGAPRGMVDDSAAVVAALADKLVAFVFGRGFLVLAFFGGGSAK